MSFKAAYRDADNVVLAVGAIDTYDEPDTTISPEISGDPPEDVCTVGESSITYNYVYNAGTNSLDPAP